MKPPTAEYIQNSPVWGAADDAPEITPKLMASAEAIAVFFIVLLLENHQIFNCPILETYLL